MFIFKLYSSVEARNHFEILQTKAERMEKENCHEIWGFKIYKMTFRLNNSGNEVSRGLLSSL